MANFIDPSLLDPSLFTADPNVSSNVPPIANPVNPVIPINPNDGVTMHDNGHMEAVSRGDIKSRHVQASYTRAQATQKNRSKHFKRALLYMEDMAIVRDPDWRNPEKSFNTAKYNAYLPAIWAQCSNKAFINPEGVCFDCLNNKGVFLDCRQVEFNGETIWKGACLSCYALGASTRCSNATNFDPMSGSRSRKRREREEQADRYEQEAREAREAAEAAEAAANAENEERPAKRSRREMSKSDDAFHDKSLIGHRRWFPFERSEDGKGASHFKYSGRTAESCRA